MSKELEALENLCDLAMCGDLSFHIRHNVFTRAEGVEKYKPVIESALKENMGLRKANEFLREDFQKQKEKINDLERIIKEPYTTIKKLKAFEIIKKKIEYFVDFDNSTKTIYIDSALDCDDEEYDLLEEVLKDE